MPPGTHAPPTGHGCPPNYSYELSSELCPPIVPPPGDLEQPKQPSLAQPELLSPIDTPAPTAKPKQGKRPGPKPKPDPEQDPTWSAFAALAVESGHVTKPPAARAKSYQKGKNRGQVLAELVAEQGADEVLAVWRHTLTSPRTTPTWWRTARPGPDLIDTFLAGIAYQRLSNDLEAVRDADRRAQRRNPANLVAVLALDGLHPLDKLLAVMRRFRFELPPEATFRAACGTDEHIADVVDAATFIGRGKFTEGWYKLARNPDLIVDLRREWDAAEPAEEAL